MNKFNPGDQVRVIASPSQVGAVLDTVAGQLRVTGPDFAAPLWFFPWELAPADNSRKGARV